MGCGTSAAVAPNDIHPSNTSSLTKSLVRDAECQTTVTHIKMTSSANARNEAHEVRKEQIMMHRVAALARAQEISNNKSGYTTATYTGSGISTPRSGYSRTRKLRGSDVGSDIDTKSKSLDSDHTNRSGTKSQKMRKSQVSFRNEEYNRIASSHSKRRKSYMNRSKTPNAKPSRKFSESNNSHDSSSTNSICKQADTGYEGSDEYQASVPSLVSATKRSDVKSSEESVCNIKDIMSQNTTTDNLSTVISVDEQSGHEADKLHHELDERQALLNSHDSKSLLLSQNSTEITEEHLPVIETINISPKPSLEECVGGKDASDLLHSNENSPELHSTEIATGNSDEPQNAENLTKVNSVTSSSVTSSSVTSSSDSLES